MMRLQPHVPRSMQKEKLPGIASNCCIFNLDGHSLGTIASH